MDSHKITQQLRNSIVTIGALALSLTAASAHPGHALDAEPVSHLVTSPYHMMTLTATGAGLLLGAVFVKRLAARRAMQVTGAVALAVAVVTSVTQMIH